MERLGPLIRIQAVEPLEGFKVRVRFKNNVQKDIDLALYLRGPIFDPIKSDIAVFRTVKVVGSTIGWDNGASIDPDVLYYNLKPAWMDEATNLSDYPLIVTQGETVVENLVRERQ